jgi:hypothetical protein
MTTTLPKFVNFSGSPYDLIKKTNSLEICVKDLEHMLHNSLDDEDSCCPPRVVYPLQSDIALLHCQRSAPNTSLLGFDLSSRVHLQEWVARTTTIEPLDRTLPSAPHRDWSREAHAYVCGSIDVLMQQKLTLNIDWIDLSTITSEEWTLSQEEACYALRSLLGNAHDVSPWCLDEADDQSTDAVLLQLPPSPASQTLIEFRVSDMCPSWYLHSVLQLKSSNDSGNCTLFAYRKLPGRPRLSGSHPDNSATCPNGTLWETVPQTAESSSADQVYTRLVAQPYFNGLQEYPQLQLLLDNLHTIQQEATAIPQWTAWPEQAHYSSATAGETKPWTVFPLCYCFPATDASQLKWIQPTTAICPVTTNLLAAIPEVRTALFSRLRPHSKLEAHTGWEDLANHVLRIHLPLYVAAGGLCGTWVDGCVETHEMGRLLCFDDSKMHWAFNYGADERVVLIVDMVRPKDLPKGTAVGGHSEELDQFIATMGA